MLICVMCPQVVVFASSGVSSSSFGDSDLPSWCSGLSKYSGYYRYTVNDDLKYVFYNGEGTAADSSYISTAFSFFSVSNGVDFSADNVIFFDYYAVTSAGYNRHDFYYFIPDDKNISKEDLFYFVSAPKGSGSSSAGSVWSKSTKKIVSGTFYRGQASYDSNVEKAYVYVYYNCSGPSSIPYEGTFDIESDIACYMTSNSIDDVYTGNVQPDNAEDLLPKRYGVLEVPQNISSTGGVPSGWKAVLQNIFGDDNITIKWTQSDPNYTKWTTEILIYGDMGVKWIYEVFSDTKKVDDLFLYSEEFPTNKLKFTIDMDKMVMNNPVWQAKISEILESTGGGCYHDCYGLSLFIRNKYSDGVCTYYSNWVELKFDDEGMSGGVNNDGSNTEYDYDDPVKGDEGTDFTQNKPTGSVNPDSPYQGDKINPSTDFSISDFLNNGFGLAGDGGLIDMFRELFSFIPAPIWTLILTGISVLIAIALLKAVF